MGLKLFFFWFFLRKGPIDQDMTKIKLKLKSRKNIQYWVPIESSQQENSKYVIFIFQKSKKNLIFVKITMGYNLKYAYFQENSIIF